MIPDYAYYWVYLVFATILCIVHSGTLKKYCSYENLYYRPDNRRQQSQFLLLLIILYFGLRPISEMFSDMTIYVDGYENEYYIIKGIRNEPIWSFIQYVCHNILGLSSRMWFLVIAAITFGFNYIACRKLLGNHIYTVLLFLISSFSFWSGAVTIIRSNFAMSLVLYGIVLFFETRKKTKMLAVSLFLMAMFTHTSSVLLSASFLVSYFIIKKTNWVLFIWFVCVVMSLVAGSYFETLFSNLGFDDRMSNMLTDVDYTGFAHAGFRWDFLIYSIVPIILGWYINKNRQIDRVYLCLLSTYIISNAFWVLVIRAQFSDRFAAISWTLYPLLLAYPLLKIKIWNNQPSKVSFALMANVAFLWLMQIYYSIR